MDALGILAIRLLAKHYVMVYKSAFGFGTFAVADREYRLKPGLLCSVARKLSFSSAGAGQV